MLQNYRDKKKQNYDPINFETLGDHSDWVLEDSPPFLTIEEVEALRNDLANMAIQPLSNDIGMLLVIDLWLQFCYFNLLLCQLLKSIN
jgi:hypothetical protein